uniref:Thyroglobulin type-1 domain-containing protein n=1 Tax=Timema tahoe TaxID=61484 RepID=A0A7R9FHF8_9NEOP|nr:unnamed protein product [Timema tahoe]
MKKIINFFLLCLIYCGIGYAAETDHLSCTTEYCDDFMATNPCSELPKVCNGTSSLAKFLPSPTVCNCCDYCLVYIGENEICAKGTSGAPTTSSICGPGLTCVKEEDASDAYCKSLNTTCIQQQQEYEERKSSGKLRMTELRPQCDEKGNFAPAHCIQGSICYCVSNTGERIFGEQVYTNSAMLTDMTCECSLAAWTSGQLLDFETQSAHCLANGSYDPLQCVGGKCICVDIEDATPVSGGKTVNIELVSNDTIPCFDSSLHEEGEFDHECEMNRVQDLNTKMSFQLQGYNVVGLETPQCTPDGNYHRVRVVNDE